jgi:hypothetical protein
MGKMLKINLDLGKRVSQKAASMKRRKEKK